MLGLLAMRAVLAEAEELVKAVGSKPVELLGVGAEAVVIRCEWRSFDAVAKVRLPKPYRAPELDGRLRRERTALEAKLLAEARKLSVPAPTLLYVNPELFVLMMDYIPGPRLREVLPSLEGREGVFRELGFYAGLLHARGIVHGDLTAANVVASSRGVFIIDFGLGSFSNDLEEQGVDVHLMLRSLESTVPSLAPSLYRAFLRGYREARGAATAELVEEKVAEIRRRGRYVAERRRVLRA
ncbi:MAG: Kae1-associated kinase Bud32 [Thermofilaceae archaeon]